MLLQDCTETKLYVEKTIPDHCFYLANKLKRSDREEVAIMGSDPLFSMLSAFRYKHRNVESFCVMSNKKPVANKELWIELDTYVATHKVKWFWVKGHSGDHYNEIADKLAVSAMHKNN